MEAGSRDPGHRLVAGTDYPVTYRDFVEQFPDEVACLGYLEVLRWPDGFCCPSGATKEETLVVEDSSRGLNSAVAASIDCAIIFNDFTNAHDFSQASYRIETLMELKGYHP